MTIMRPICHYYDYRKHNRQVIGVVLWMAIAAIMVFPAGVTAQETGSDPLAQADTGVPAEPWDRAVEAVQYRRHADAIPLLRLVASREGEHRAEAFRLLAHSLEQEGRIEDAEATLREAIDAEGLSPSEAGRLAFDLGALLQRHDRAADAQQMYTRALRFDGAVAPAYLNRANLRVEAGTYPDAIADYELYLALRPRSPQRPQ